MQEAWRAYLDVALGFTEASRKRTMKVAKKLVGRGGATAEQLQSMAEDLVSTSAANRESMVRLVRFELDRALGRVGLATAEEVSQLTARVRELEEELRLARSGAGPAVVAAADDELAASTVPATPAVPSPTKVVRKTVAKKAVAGANGAAPAKAAPAKAAPAKAAAPAKVAPPAKGVSPTRAAALAKAATTTDATPATLAKSAPTKAVAKKTAAKAPAKKTTPAKAADGGTTGTQP